jgi:hypothetical protein
VQQALDIRVFWFFSSEKNKESSFSEEKEAKRLLISVHRVRRSGTWPETDAWAGVMASFGRMRYAHCMGILP